MSGPVDFGSLNPVLERSSGARNLASWDASLVSASHLGETLNLLESAGPISDAYILGNDPVGVIEGPVGSGKTIASIKKGLYSAQRMLPTANAPDGRPLRRYVLSVWRQKYDDLWGSTIPSWWMVFPKDTFPDWVGAKPRSAQHNIHFEDQWGPVLFTALFMAFGEQANPEDLRGRQYTDAWLNEIDTMPENLFTYLVGRVGRDPPPEVMKRHGRIFGDQNAPDVLAWTYRDFSEKPKDGYTLYRQPGGRDDRAENRRAVSRGYYDNQARINAHRPWYVKRMVDGIPGMTRGTDLVYDKYDDETMFSKVTLDVYPQIPVIVGIDEGMTPAAAYCQEGPGGQGRTLAEIALERGGMEELADAMLALEASPRFKHCEFHTVCDPSMTAGEPDVVKSGSGKLEVREGIQRGSSRQMLAKLLGRQVHEAQTNQPARRWGAVREKIGKNLGPGRPGYVIDPSCKVIRRGKLQTYHFLPVRGTNDLSRVAKTFDSHATEAEQYAYLEMGTALAQKRQSDIKRAREERLAEGRKKAGRYSPLRRG